MISQEHAGRLLTNYGIDVENPYVLALIHKKLLCSMPPEQTESILGMEKLDTSSLYIGYPNHENVFSVRLDKPFMSHNDKPVKYLKPRGQGNALYIPIGVSIETKNLLIITEGELKALSGYLIGLPVVAISGIWNWLGKREGLGDEQVADSKAIIPDIVDLPLGGRQIALIYDSDINPDHKGYPAFPRLAEQLYRLGADTVKIITLPALVSNGKTGLDDLIVHYRGLGKPDQQIKEMVIELIEQSSSYLPVKEGALPYANYVKGKENPKNEEKIRAVASVIQFTGMESRVREYANYFGRNAASLMKDAKKLLKQISRKKKTISNGLVTLADEILDIILQKDDKDNSPPREVIRKNIFIKIKQVFFDEGEFFKSDDGSQRFWWFFKKDHHLFDIYSNEFKAFFINHTGLDTAADWGKDGFNRLKAYIEQEAKPVAIHCVSYYNVDTQTLYIDKFDGLMFKLDGNKISLVPVGTDDILFFRDESWESWQLVDATDEDRKRFEDLLLGVKFSKDVGILPGYAATSFFVWWLASFFRELNPTCTLLLLRGEKGSGKSSLVRIWLRLLFGNKEDLVTVSQDNIQAFESLITNLPWVGIDNLDSSVKKLMDLLATTATRASIPKRQLYETNKLVKFPIIAWLIITARTPRIKRDDIAERLILLDLDQLEAKKGERTLQETIDRYRNKFMSILISMLNDIVRHIREQGLSQKEETFRMADYASFLRTILQYVFGEGGDLHANAILHQITNAQSEYLINDDTLVELIEELLKSSKLKYGETYSLTALKEAINKLTGQKKSTFVITHNGQLKEMLTERAQAALSHKKLRFIFTNKSGSRHVRIEKVSFEN